MPAMTASQVHEARLQRWRWRAGARALQNVMRTEFPQKGDAIAPESHAEKFLAGIWQQDKGYAKLKTDPNALTKLPEWAHWTKRQRNQKALLIGCMLHAERLAASINGKNLALISKVLGVSLTEHVVEKFAAKNDLLPLAMKAIPQISLSSLVACGGEVMKGSYRENTAISQWLSHLFEPSDLLSAPTVEAMQSWEHAADHLLLLYAKSTSEMLLDNNNFSASAPPPSASFRVLNAVT
jgi:hypothetical protein